MKSLHNIENTINKGILATKNQIKPTFYSEKSTFKCKIQIRLCEVQDHLPGKVIKIQKYFLFINVI